MVLSNETTKAEALLDGKHPEDKVKYLSFSHKKCLVTSGNSMLKDTLTGGPFHVKSPKNRL